jgi:hypothetical protein
MLALLRHGGAASTHAETRRLDLVGVAIVACSTLPLVRLAAVAARRVCRDRGGHGVAGCVRLPGRFGRRAYHRACLLASDRTPASPWTGRTMTVVVGLLLATWPRPPRRRAFPGIELLHVGLARAGGWFAGDWARPRGQYVRATTPASLPDRISAAQSYHPEVASHSGGRSATT